MVCGHSADGRPTHIVLRHAASQGWEGRSAFHEVSRTCEPASSLWRGCSNVHRTPLRSTPALARQRLHGFLALHIIAPANH